MKRLLSILMIITMVLAGIVLVQVAVIGCARAASIKLVWNAQADAAEFRVWRGLECLSTVRGTTATVTVPDAEASTFTVTALNSAGESAHSTAVSIPAPNATRLTLQVSTDLITWQDIASYYDAKKPAAFYRVKVEVRP